MFTFWRDGAWRRMRRGDFAQAVAAVAAGLRAQGVTAGDRVVLVAENRPEFIVADTAVMSIGAVTVPTYVSTRWPTTRTSCGIPGRGRPSSPRPLSPHGCARRGSWTC
jgi:long-subunit acyl-CoA synthetase (AMP-forming)